MSKSKQASNDEQSVINIQKRYVTSKIQVNNFNGATFRERKPELLLVTFVESRSESARLSQIQNREVYVWRADQVEAVYRDNSSEILSVLREENGPDVNHTVHMSRKFDKTIDPRFWDLIDIIRPTTKPEDTPGAHLDDVHLCYPAGNSRYGHTEHDASVVGNLARHHLSK